MNKKNIKKSNPEEVKRKREQGVFKRKILSTFKNMGFEYLKVDGIHRKFGFKQGELDYVFLYENIILICEDTITKSGDTLKNHLKNKNLLFQEINNNIDNTISWLKNNFSEKFEKFNDYNFSRYKVFNLYISKNKIGLDDDEKKLYSNLITIEIDTLNYFNKVSKNIKYSSINEFYRFLNITGNEIGYSSSESKESTIDTLIISPEDNTSLNSGARVISFMMSANKLMKNSYVLRKDSWEESSGLYQRLIEKNRIESIRLFLAKNKEAFINNIIVSLPDDITLKDKDGNFKNIKDIDNFNGHKMSIPDRLNSICIIDGQHRIFAHYKGNDKNEKTIEKLRDKLHLLVTGLIFPDNVTKYERIKYESELFLNINSNAKPVPQDVLLHIETLKDPFSSIGIARNVLEILNKNFPFNDLFQLSLMKKSKIKIPSIIKFALRYIVEISDEKETYFKYWNNDEKEILLEDDNDKKEQILEEYKKFIVYNLTNLFKGLYYNFKSDWNDENSKILSTTSINAFIIGHREVLKEGIINKDFNFYEDKFSNFEKDYFNKSIFPYTSSQYTKFSKIVIEKLKEY